MNAADESLVVGILDDHNEWLVCTSRNHRHRKRVLYEYTLYFSRNGICVIALFFYCRTKNRCHAFGYVALLLTWHQNGLHVLSVCFASKVKKEKRFRTSLWGLLMDMRTTLLLGLLICPR